MTSVLNQLSQGNESAEEIIKRLQAELSAEKAKSAKMLASKVRFSVSNKSGWVSFWIANPPADCRKCLPLQANEFRAILAHADELKAFLDAPETLEAIEAGQAAKAAA